MDDHSSTSADSAETSKSARAEGAPHKTPARSYTDAARPERQPRISDLVPLRPWAMSVLLLSLLTAAVGLFALDGQAAAWSRHVGRENLIALDFSARGSLAGWFGSVLLGAAASASVLIFLLRRHKVDDYNGRYRFWLWTAVLLVLASIDAGAGVHRIASGLLVRTTGLLVQNDGLLWTLMLAGVLYGFVVLRGVFEIRHSRGALLLLMTATALHLTAIAIALGFVLSPGALATLVAQSALLLGRLATLSCVLIFARYVLLDAQGKLPERRVRPQRKRKAEDSPEASNSKQDADEGPLASRTKRRKLRVDASHVEQNDETPTKEREAAAGKSSTARSSSTSGQTAARPSKEQAAGKVSVDLDDEIAESASNRKLSKAERRRLRKEQRRGANP